MKSKERSTYASVLLIGNVTGKYVFNDFYYESVKGLNIDAFSKENQELLQELKSHFAEYIINNNKRDRAQVKTVKQITEMSSAGWIKIRNLGRKSYEEIAEKMHGLGLKIAPYGTSTEVC